MYPSNDKPYAGVYVKSIVDELSARGARIDLLAMERRFTKNLGSITKYILFFVRSVAFSFRRYKIIHLHFIFPLIYLGVGLKVFNPGSKLVITCHGSDVNSHFNSKFSRFFAQFFAKFVDEFVCVGEELRLSTQYKLKVDVRHVFPAGVNDNVFRVDQIRRKNDRIYDLIFVGSFSELKGVPDLVLALLDVPDSLSLCFIGSGPCLENIKLLNEKHAVTIHENLVQSDIAYYYRNSRFLILTSKSEAFGLVISEAMYCGTPVIASNVGGIPMQVRNGFNGFLFDSIDHAGIYKAVIDALSIHDDSYYSLCYNASRSNKNFSLSNVAEKHLLLYKALLNESEA